MPDQKCTKEGADRNEKHYVAAGWPVVWDKTGNKAYFIGPKGEPHYHINENGSLGNGKDPITLDEIFEKGKHFDEKSLKPGWKICK